MIDNFLEVINLDPFQLVLLFKDNKFFVEDISLKNDSNNSELDISELYLNLDNIKTKSFNRQEDVINYIKNTILNLDARIVYNVTFDGIISSLLSSIENAFKVWLNSTNKDVKLIFNINFIPTSNTSPVFAELIYTIVKLDVKNIKNGETINIIDDDVLVRNSILINKQYVHVTNIN